MTHEYDDPIKPEDLAEAARITVSRRLAEGRSLDDLAREIVEERFCSCVASPEQPDTASILEGMIAAVIERARGMLAARQLLDRIDRASNDSFPASDAPAWISREPSSK